jgi:hypothetical protein
MISLLNGIEEGDHFMFRGENQTLKVVLMDNDGLYLTTTADVIKLKLYAHEDRREAAVFTSDIATITTAAAGLETIDITAAQMNFAANTDGKPYYGFIERNENVGSTYEYSRKAHRIFIK